MVKVIGNDCPDVRFNWNDRHEITKSNHGADHSYYIGGYPDLTLDIRKKTEDTSSHRVGKGTDGPCRDTVETAFREPRGRATFCTKVVPL